MKSGSRKKSKRIRLGSRDRALLAHIGLYGMSWVDVMQAAHFEGRHPDAVISTVRRLLSGKRPLIRSVNLYGKRVYYQLTFAGTRAINISHRAAEAIGRTTVIRQYALQSFYFLGKQEQRHPLGKEQLGSILYTPGRRLPKSQFYLASTGTADKRLGFVLVDFGSDPRRCANRIVDRVLQLLENTKIRSLAEVGVFDLSVLTLTSSKLKSLYQRLNVSGKTGGNLLITSRSKRFRVRLWIHVIPGLLELIPDSREK